MPKNIKILSTILPKPNYGLNSNGNDSANSIEVLFFLDFFNIILNKKIKILVIKRRILL